MRARGKNARLGRPGTRAAPLMGSRRAAALLLVTACRSPSPSGAAPEATVSTAIESSASAASAPAPSLDDAAPQAAIANACNAPSVRRLAAPDDARDFARFAGCNPYEAFFATWDEEEAIASTCGRSTQTRRADLAKMLDAVPPLDDTTAAHVRAIVLAGRARGRRPRRWSSPSAPWRWC